MKTKPHCKNAGYSLLELIIVIAILSILATIGVLNYNNYNRTLQLREVNNSIAQLFQDTAARAINRNTSFTITFNLNQIGGADMSITGDGSSESFKLEADASITSVQVKGLNQSSIEFNTRGRPSNADALVLKTSMGNLTGTVRLLNTGKTVVQ
jgi:prepilin-type N-terminal cleavage/methylation domain-containing protein